MFSMYEQDTIYKTIMEIYFNNVNNLAKKCLAKNTYT